MKARVFFLLSIVMLMLFSACNAGGGVQTDEPGALETPGSEDTRNTEEAAKVTRDQAIHIIGKTSNDTGDMDINSYPEMDKVVDNVRYYFIQVVFANKMSAAYYVDSMEGKVFIAMGGELDTRNPLPDMETDGSGPSSSEDAGGVTEITGSVTAVVKDIFDSFGMTGEQVEQKFGSDYTKVSLNYGGYMEGFLYSGLGVTIAFDSGGKVTCVYCTDKIEINGAKAGMDFSQIQEKLGETSFRQTWVETPIDTAYEIEYRFNGRTVIFFSRQNEGDNSIMVIS